MVGEIFTVKYVRSKTAFLYLPISWAQKMQDLHELDSATILQVLYNNEVAYFSWQTNNLLEGNCVGLNATFASKLGLDEGAPVYVSFYGHSSSVKRVEMSPLSFDDLDIIEQNSNLIQMTLLDQVRVVWKGQILTIWISNSLPVTLRIGILEPNMIAGRLEQLTEVAVGHPGVSDQSGELSSSEVSSQESDLANSSSSVFDFLTKSKNFALSLLTGENDTVNSLKPEETSTSKLKPKQYKNGSNIFRVHPMKTINNPSQSNVYISRKHFIEIVGSQTCAEGQHLYKLSKLQSPKELNIEKSTVSNDEEELQQQQASNDKPKSTASMRVNLKYLEENGGAVNDYKCIFIPDNIRRALSLEIGSRVKLNKNSLERQIALKQISLSVLSVENLNTSAILDSLKNYVDSTPDGTLLSNGQLLNLKYFESNVDVVVNLVPNKLDSAVITPELLSKCQVSIHLRRSGLVTLNHLDQVLSWPTIHTSHLEEILMEGRTSLEISLPLLNGFLKTKSIFRANDNILIQGKRGSGKTTTSRALCRSVQDSPHYVYFSFVSCRPLKGKKAETIFKVLLANVSDCVYRQPSILVLDDLDSIAGVSQEQDQENLQGNYFNRIAKLLVGLLREIQINHQVALIATASSSTALCSPLVSTRGTHFFNTLLELPDLTKADRLGVLNSLLSEKMREKDFTGNFSDRAVDDCSLKTEGYSCQDLSDLVDKSVFAAWRRLGASGKQVILEDKDLEEGLSESIPMLLRGINLHKDASYSWDDIGGLSDVKVILTEVLQWPSMYPELFQNSPLRHQSGLLLYGAPGTGKTMIAGAVAQECNLNFISVKGPELLSKYIGASEEAVRNIFQKAQSAKPCVLFFDEFDSLAPRRGHDSTGVTDRVVNQLLTQLDGVESLVGVWVLAATSRPDLLDPALLRPGRLDRCVLCPLPDETDRISILAALSKRLLLDSDVNLAGIAAATSDFTGADLQAVLYTAQLSAVEEYQKNDQAKTVLTQENEQIAVTIHQKHLQESLLSTRPSLSEKERLKYKYIYDRFLGNNKQDIEDQQQLGRMQRATLA